MKKIIVLSSAVALSCVVSIRAQQAPGAATPGPGIRVFSIRPLEARSVTGMPYAAEIVTESIQSLADGNRIVQRTTGRVYRDSEGRVRREEDRPSGGPAVTITDPVASRSYTLDSANLTAREGPALFSLYVGRANTELQELALRLQGLAGGAASGARGRGTVQVFEWDRRGRGAPADGVESEERLSDRLIEGVLASGVRRTTTIEKGAIGNEQPIKIVSEEWMSSDLQVLVMTDFNDPRTGRSTYRLLNITRSDPDPGLFQVPANFTMQRMPTLGGRAASPAGVRGGGRGGRGGARGQ